MSETGKPRSERVIFIPPITGPSYNLRTFQNGATSSIEGYII